MSTPYTSAERRKLLDEYFAALERTRELEGATDADVETLSRLWDEYVAGTPIVDLARCPFTLEVVHHSFDPFGLDGLWWNFDATARPTEALPSTYFALTGAVHLAEPVEVAPFLCKPGPEVPFVIPRILERQEIKAVVSCHKVGDHTSYPIFYFARPIPFNLERVNTWGTADYRFVNQVGDHGWNTSSWDRSDFDFDLRPWIEMGKLLWIAEGDGKVELHTDAAACPYLGLPGRRVPLNVEGGEVWSSVSWTEAPIESPKPAEPAKRFCRNCGAEVNPGATFCPACGTKL